METLRARYTTPRCLSVKTSLVRSMCGMSEEYARARAALRAPMMGTLMARCTALMERTITTVAQRVLALDKFAGDGTELSSAGQQIAFARAMELTREARDLGC